MSTVTDTPSRVLLADVVRATARVAGVEPAVLTGESRSAVLVRFRYAGMVVAHRRTGRGTPAIGRAFGRDHSAVWKAFIAAGEKVPRSKGQHVPGLYAVIARVEAALDGFLLAPSDSRSGSRPEGAGEADGPAPVAPGRLPERESGATSKTPPLPPPSYGLGMLDAADRRWFQENDQRFCSAFARGLLPDLNEGSTT